jgi:YHS domain-containing protein
MKFLVLLVPYFVVGAILAVLFSLLVVREGDPICPTCGVYVPTGRSIKRIFKGRVLHFCSAGCNKSFWVTVRPTLKSIQLGYIAVLVFVLAGFVVQRFFLIPAVLALLWVVRRHLFRMFPEAAGYEARRRWAQHDRGKRPPGPPERKFSISGTVARDLERYMKGRS